MIDTIIETVKNQSASRLNGCLSMAAERQLVKEVERLRQEVKRIATDGADRIRAGVVALNYLDGAITGLQRDTPIEVLNEIPRLARAGVIQALANARKLTGKSV